MDAPPASDPTAPDLAASEPPKVRRRRIVVLSLTLSILVVGYAVVFTYLYNQPPAVERVFTAPGNQTKQPLDVYLEVLSIDPNRQAIEARLDFAAKTDPEGVDFDYPPGANMVVYASDGYDVQDIALQRSVRPPSKTLELDVEGRLENYPLDQYRGKLLIRAFEGTPAARGAIIPIRLTAWEELSRWSLTVDSSAPNESGLSLNIKMRRPPAQVFFAFLLYAAMALIGGSAVTIGSLTYVGTRRVEATLIAALGAMIFAVPALRNIMPGAPPLGVRADSFVFLWVQLTTIIALTLFVATWAWRGPQP